MEPCDELVSSLADGTTITWEKLRTTLQGSFRAYSAENFFDRFGFLVLVARSQFEDLHNERHFFPEWPSLCPRAASALGALALINSPINEAEALFDASGTSVFARPSSHAARHTVAALALKAVEAALESGTFLTEAGATASAAGDQGAELWPFFALLASLCERLPVPASGVPPEPSPAAAKLLGSWQLWLDSDAWNLPPGLLPPTLLADGGSSNPGLQRCSPAAAVGKIAGGGGVGAAATMIRECYAERGVALLTRRWASVWRGLDRLTTERVVNVVEEENPPAVSFNMSLLPPHISESERSHNSFRFVADFIRGAKRPHCHSIFRELADHILGSMETQPLILDVGAHLGDCCLWAAARWRSSFLRCYAFDCNSEAVAAVRRSVALNDLSGAVKVFNRSVATEATGCSASRYRSRGPSLDSLVAKLGRVDILKLHVGSEPDSHAHLEILSDLHDSLQAGRVTSCLVRTSNSGLTPSMLAQYVVSNGLPYTVWVPPGSHNLMTVLLLSDDKLVQVTKPGGVRSIDMLEQRWRFSH
eukprot:TRINITY_DN107215_c0_g1_i1.p1 TRINITY_DN107215_c0_g1~~TRINITY_DN107215_c0_g1_i1.p1  ORF type:complete len:534 (-),score=94.89 TRINITY_DN107215_c0_g1_i1:10-1611(-)